MRIKWEKLLCADTLGEREKIPQSWKDYPMDPFEQDYREIISGELFRHLQDKAQMYQMVKGEFVRTRLTHSLEVSTIAKQLGIMLIYNEKWNKAEAFRDLTVDQARTIPTVLACAGLLHDMGNPPFGHEGEYAMGMWFREKLQSDDFRFFDRPVRECLTESMRSDLEQFEGNAQIIRMLSKCRYAPDADTPNLSYAVVSTLIKYPVSAAETDRSSPDLRVRKFGYYTSEKDVVRTVREKTGLDLPDAPHARNPLTYLLEAADDIAYVTSDTEDAVAKGTITIPQLVAFLRRKIAELSKDGDEKHQLQLLTAEGICNNLVHRLDACAEENESERVMALHGWLQYLRTWLMYVAAISFVENQEAIMDGTYCGDLLEESLHRYTVEILKSEMYENVYPRLGTIHVAAYNVLTDLMERYAGAVVYRDTERPMERMAMECVNTIPDAFRDAYLRERTGDREYDLYLRFRMVTDYIASMSDRFALDLYKSFNAFSF